jgi:hypothetical protein
LVEILSLESGIQAVLLAVECSPELSGVTESLARRGLWTTSYDFCRFAMPDRVTPSAVHRFLRALPLHSSSRHHRGEMSAGSKVVFAEQQLMQLLMSIREENLSLFGKGRRPNFADPKDAKFFEKIENWTNRLRELDDRLSRMLRAVEGERAFRLRRMPAGENQRHAAYRAKQSIDSRVTTIEDARLLAEIVTEELERLFVRSIGSDKAYVKEKSLDLADNLLKFIKELKAKGVIAQEMAERMSVAVSSGRQEWLTPARQESLAPDYFGAITLILVLLRILFLERRRNDSSHRF